MVITGRLDSSQRHRGSRQGQGGFWEGGRLMLMDGAGSPALGRGLHQY